MTRCRICGNVIDPEMMEMSSISRDEHCCGLQCYDFYERQGARKRFRRDVLIVRIAMAVTVLAFLAAFVLPFLAPR